MENVGNQWISHIQIEDNQRTEAVIPPCDALSTRRACIMGHPCQMATSTHMVVVRQMAHRATFTKDRGLPSAAESALRGEAVATLVVGEAATGVFGFGDVAPERFLIASAAMMGSAACMVGLSGSEMARSDGALGGDKEIAPAMGETLRERHVEDALEGRGEIMSRRSWSRWVALSLD